MTSTPGSTVPTFRPCNARFGFQDLRIKEFSAGVEPSPCFSNFLARTTFILVSLPEAKNPGQDAFLGILSLTVVILDIKAYLIIDCDYW